MTNETVSPHLCQITQDKVESFYWRILANGAIPYHVKLELDAFRESRTPWDGLRVANALHHFKMVPEIVKELDEIAKEAGITPRERAQK
jgi:hypothetical protein